MRVLISGCGYVGGALGELLVRDGHEVYGLRRSPRGMPSGIEPVTADFTDPESLRRALPGGLDYVFHTASPGVSGKSTPEEREAAYHDAYLRGPSNVISALRSRGERPLRILMTSSTGVYAQNGGEWIDEESATETPGPGRLMLQGEEILLDSPFSAVVVRLAGIYGPGRTGALERARRYPLSSVESTTYTNRIHRDDCVGVLRHLMLLERPAPMYIGADHEPATLGEIAAWLARDYPGARQETGEDPIRRSMRTNRARRTNKRCSNARLLRSGYSFEYPSFREGFASLLG